MDAVKVRLRNPDSPSDLAWSDVPYQLPEQCDHTETMCRDCRLQWEWDHEVQTNDQPESASPTLTSDPDGNSPGLGNRAEQ